MLLKERKFQWGTKIPTKNACEVSVLHKHQHLYDDLADEFAKN